MESINNSYNLKTGFAPKILILEPISGSKFMINWTNS